MREDDVVGLPLEQAKMTTLALTTPPLKRLFERLDFSPRPTIKTLTAISEYWRAKCGHALFPSIADVDPAELEAGSAEAFLYRARVDGRDFELVTGGTVLKTLLGSANRGETLSAVPRRRAAARLRRLFEAVVSAAEPLLANFVEESEFVELIVAPVSSDGHRVNGIFGGVATRPLSFGGRRAIEQSSTDQGPMVFGIGSSEPFAARVCSRLGVDLSPLEERSFEDGEQKIRPLVSVRNRDVYVVHSLNGEAGQTANDKLCRLLFLIGALKDASATSVTAVVPYLCYSRKDRQTKARDPITTRYVAQLFEAMGTDRLVAMEVHNVAAFQNAFRCHTEHLDANSLFAKHFMPLIGDAPVAVVSPDPGGVKRAELFRQRLEGMLKRPVAAGFMDKHRSMGEVTGEMFAGDVAGRNVIVIDDLISTGGTMVRMATACREHGATRVSLATTHALFSERAGEVLGAAPVDQIVITDSVSLPPSAATKLGDRLIVVGVARVFAEAIRRCHTGGSIVELLASDFTTD